MVDDYYLHAIFSYVDLLKKTQLIIAILLITLSKRWFHTPVPSMVFRRPFDIHRNLDHRLPYFLDASTLSNLLKIKLWWCLNILQLKKFSLGLEKLSPHQINKYMWWQRIHKRLLYNIRIHIIADGHHHLLAQSNCTKSII